MTELPLKAARGVRLRGAAFFISTVFIAYCGMFPLVTTDIWWHLAAAREMLARGAFLHTDPFSVTAFGYPWLNVHWLFQLVMYAVHAAGGIAGLIGCRALLFAGTWALLFMAGGERRVFWSGIIAMNVTAYSIRTDMLMRPGLFTLLFMALFLFVLERFRKSGRGRWLWLLLPVQAVWANMQGLFLIGPVLLCLVLAGELAAWTASKYPLAYVSFVRQYNRRSIGMLAGTLAGTLLACLLNPYGWRMLTLPFKLFGVITPLPANPFTTGVAENTPGWMTGAGGIETLLLQLAGSAFILLVIINRRRLVPFRLLLFTSFLLLSVMAGRNVPLYAAVLIPLLMAEYAALPAGMKVSGIIRKMLLPVSGVILAFLCMTALWLRMAAPHTGMTVPFRYPAGATEYLNAHPVAGTVFNAARHGGFLLWHRYPAQRVFCDGRFTIRPGAYLRDYTALLDVPASFSSFFEKYGITHAVLPIDRRQRYAGLAVTLYRHPDWVLAYTDGADAVFVRNNVFAGSPELPDGSVVRGRVATVFGNRDLRARAFDNLRILSK